MQIYDFLSQKARNAASSLQFGCYKPSFYAEAAEVIRERIQKRALSVHNETERARIQFAAWESLFPLNCRRRF